MKKVIESCDDHDLAGLFLKVVRVSTGSVVGTPGAARSFRSKLLAATCMFGPWTAFPTYNPCELYAQPVLRLAGAEYGFDLEGCPDDRFPDSATRHVIAASRPALCATYFMATMRAEQLIVYGWKPGAVLQDDSNCVFGKVRIVRFSNVVPCARSHFRTNTP